MGVGMEASASRRSGTLRRQPAYGEYTEQPEIEAQYDRSDQESAGDELGRRAQWPFLLLLALMEIAWLGALGYVIHGFVLSPIFG